MKLLIVTQTVDTEDPVLGFFVHWITELAKHHEHIEVICLREGIHALPANVRVHSLGKERGAVSRAAYTWRFISLAWRLRGDYDAVFVHMNQEYILIAGWLWKLLGKRIYLWRNHYAGSWLTDVAAAFCTKVFCTSKYSYTAKYAKTVLMPVGIDTGVFKPEGQRRPRSILFLARMAPSKRPEVLLDALHILAKKGVEFTASFVGSPLAQDQGWYEELKKGAEDIPGMQFHPSVTNGETPALYGAHEFFVNASRSGMYDKTIFEALACGSLTLAASEDYAESADPRLVFDGSSEDLALKLEALLRMSEEEKKNLHIRMRESMAQQQSLSLLGNELVRSMRARRAVLFQNGSIGDFLMFTYLSELLMASGRFSDITIIVPRNAAFLRGLISAYPYLSVLEISSKHWGEIRRLWGGTKTVLIHPTIGKIPLRVKLLAWLISRGRESELVGFQDKGSLCSLYSKTLPYDTNKPYIETTRELTRAAGAQPNTLPPRLRFEGSSDILAASGLEGKSYIVFHPGASNPKRMFAIDDAAEVACFILEKFPDTKLVLSGGPDEREYISSIRHAVGREDIITAVDTSAGDIATLVKHARLFVGTNTGITHLACFLGVRVIEVAHNTAAYWLTFYAPMATVLYRLIGENVVRSEQKYLQEHSRDVLRPLTSVPVDAVCSAIGEVLQ